MNAFYPAFQIDERVDGSMTIHVRKGVEFYEYAGILVAAGWHVDNVIG